MPKRRLSDLVTALSDLRHDVKIEADEMVNEVALKLVTELAYTTPVDTSKALSNWRVTNRQILGVRDAHVEGEGGSTRKASALRTIANARRVINRRKSGGKLTVYNAAPYIRRLDDGWSSQQPPGFILRAIKVATGQLSRKRKASRKRRFK